MIRIVFITTGLSIGGAEGMLLKLLEKIDQKHFKPYVISLLLPAEIGIRIKNLGIPVFTLGMKKAVWAPFALAQLLKIFRQIRPNIVQTWMYHADFLGGIAARLCGIKNVVWSIRNSDLSEKAIKRLTRFIAVICAKTSSVLPKQILCCSKRAAEVHERLGYARDKIKVIPNGFDLALFRPDQESKKSVRNELGLMPDSLLVGLVARYDSQKNHSGFIIAAKEIHRGMPHVHFVLAGTGVDERNNTLTKMIEVHNLKSHFHLLGKRSDMCRIMASLDVLASSSYGDAFPNVLGEAMACGVPCVVTDVGDSAEIVGETGRVVPSGDMSGLAWHIQEILSLPREKRACLGQKARARVNDKYDIHLIAKQYEENYKTLVYI